MDKNELKHVEKIEKMMRDLPLMNKEEIMNQFKILGCLESYDSIIEQLKLTYNELKVSDSLFEKYEINDDQCVYPKEFIDMAIGEIILRIEPFSFTHYGIICDEMIENMETDLADELKLEHYELCFKKFFKLCKIFKVDNLDAFLFEVNNGFDLYAVLVDYLDECMEKGRMSNPKYYQQIIDFCLRFKKQFKKVNPFIQYSVDTELATVYVAIKDPKGEKMFLDAIKNHHDKTEAVLHYALSYIDNDELRALKIFDRYQSLLNKESDCYEIIEQIRQDAQEHKIS